MEKGYIPTRSESGKRKRRENEKPQYEKRQELEVARVWEPDNLGSNFIMLSVEGNGRISVGMGRGSPGGGLIWKCDKRF